LFSFLDYISVSNFVLHVYFWLSLSTFYNHQIMASIRVSYSGKSEINYIWMPSFMYQDVINLCISPSEVQVYIWMLRCDTLYSWVSGLLIWHYLLF